MTPSPTQSEILEALRSFLLAVLPATGSDEKPVDVILGQQNRVPEPIGSDFAVLSPLRFTRLATNVDDEDGDVRFTGSIAGTVMTASAVDLGVLQVGATVFGVGVASGTSILSQTSGPTGGPGTYVVAPGQTIGSETLSAGRKPVTQNAQCTVQIDFHGALVGAADVAQAVSTLFRDGFAVDFFAALAAPLDGVIPLHADDPRQAPFINEEQQVEWRWILEAELQVQQATVVPQQFADAVSVQTISVDAAYPPA